MEISIQKSDWDNRLVQLLASHEIYAPLRGLVSLDYHHLEAEDIPDIVYNHPKPVSPLKTFFLPVKENVTEDLESSKTLIIIGAPSCDVAGLALLDAIYMDADFPDPSYSWRREHSILISMDCHSIQDHCHCTSYGVEPRASSGADLGLAVAQGTVVLRSHSPKGKQLVEAMGMLVPDRPSKEVMENLEGKLKDVKEQLEEQNRGLPDYESTGKLIKGAPGEVWLKYATDCVSCGACSAICPTCSCFLLIDRPGFEKVRSLDTCQHPGFERVAGGEDPLHSLADRFRNRYMCKYIWRPEQHSLQACTGCGRCSETCIGQIDKNELIQSLSN